MHFQRICRIKKRQLQCICMDNAAFVFPRVKPIWEPRDACKAKIAIIGYLSLYIPISTPYRAIAQG